jgi:CHAD domain-containing protein
MSENLWRRRVRSLRKARKSLRENEAEAIHDLRVALRRLGVTAAALGEKKIERRARHLASRLAQLRQLEVDRGLLARVHALGILPEDAYSGLQARWDARSQADARKALRIAQGPKMRRLITRARRRSRRDVGKAMLRLDLERTRAERRLTPPGDRASDRDLHRYRLSIKRARYLAEDLAACGAPNLDVAIAREREVQEALGRWNDVRLFRLRLIQTRAEAEERGSVTLALELDRVINALEGTVAATRAEALAVASRLGNVIPFLQRSA